MSPCIDAPARADGLVALLCMSCVVSQLLLILDVESASLLHAAVSSAVKATLPAGARRGLVLSRQRILTAGRRVGSLRRPCEVL